MKSCIKCVRNLPLDSFYTHPRMADGHLNICKGCHKQAMQDRYAAKNGNAVYERARSQRPERRKKAVEYQRKARATNPEKFKARNAVNNAIRDGRLQRRSCAVCGSPEAQAHHDDYAKPLDVEWLCFAHHREHAHGQTTRVS